MSITFKKAIEKIAVLNSFKTNLLDIKKNLSMY